MENKALFISKVKNIYIMLMEAITNENIDSVDLFLDDTLTKNIEILLNQTKKVIQKYDYLNISNVEIMNETDEFVSVNANVRYTEDRIDKKTKKIVGGSDTYMNKYTISMKFRKNQIEEKLVHKYPKCGANLNINKDSFCEYCRSPTDER